ncbi:MAG: ATP-binding protein [Bacteroidetes bacterium]|nr:ATP-binding protein [Bacteroidota bacterium]
MISFTKGQTIAEVVYKDPQKKSLGAFSSDKKLKKKEIKLFDETLDQPEIIPNNLDEMLPKSFYSGLRNISSTNLILLKKAIKTQNKKLLPIGNNAMNDAYNAANLLLIELCKKNFFIPPTEGYIECLPLQESSRVSIFGPSGVGKSTWTGNFLEQYHKKYKKNKIYVFSPIREDGAFKKVETEYVRLEDSILDHPLQIQEFKDSCCVFDDIESINDKKIRQSIETFRDICLETGRHENITTLCISHVILNGPSTKRMLNESDQVVVFARSNFNAIKNLCVRYYGFSRDDVNYLKQIGEKSRWQCIKRSFPTCIISQNNIRVI